MATPLTGMGHRDGGGGVAIMAGPVNAVDPSPPASSSSSSSKVSAKNSAQKSPILIFLFFHKAIKSELEGLHRAAVDFVTNQKRDIKPLLERYHFLRSIYKHHCNAEDEVGCRIFVVTALLIVKLNCDYLDYWNRASSLRMAVFNFACRLLLCRFAP